MLTDAVVRAIREIEDAFPGQVQTREDGDGGAFVLVEGVELGGTHTPATSWIGFRVQFQTPYCDVYPHFVTADLARADGAPLGAGMSQGHTFEGRTAVQLSRRSNRHNPMTDTPLLKLLKVIEWVRIQP